MGFKAGRALVKGLGKPTMKYSSGGHPIKTAKKWASKAK